MICSIGAIIPQCDLPVVRTVLDQLGLHFIPESAIDASDLLRSNLRRLSSSSNCDHTYERHFDVVDLPNNIWIVGVYPKQTGAKPALVISHDVRCNALSNKNLGV
jgi:hypothetical protein